MLTAVALLKFSKAHLLLSKMNLQLLLVHFFYSISLLTLSMMYLIKLRLFQIWVESDIFGWLQISKNLKKKQTGHKMLETTWKKTSKNEFGGLLDSPILQLNLQLKHSVTENCELSISKLQTINLEACKTLLVKIPDEEHYKHFFISRTVYSISRPQSCYSLSMKII